MQKIGYSSTEWLSTFRSRIKCVIRASNIDGDLSDFPVLISLSSSTGSTSSDLTYVFDENGDEDLKIAVTTSDGVTQCPVEMVSWDGTGETAEFWTKLPSISSTVDTVFYLYFDDNIADNSTYVGVTGSTIAETVWDNNFVLVCHMEDNPDTSHVMDSTSNDNDGTKKAANEPNEVDGKIGKAQDFDGNDDYLDIASSAELNPDDGDFTLELWINTNKNYDGQYVIWRKDKESAVPRRLFGFEMEASNKLTFTLYDTSTAKFIISDAALNDGVYHHIVGKKEGDNLYLFVDAVLQTSTESGVNAMNVSSADKIRMGTYTTLLVNFFDGIIDENRLSIGIARSSAWVAASYETQNNTLIEYHELQYRSPFFMEAIKNFGITLGI